MTIRLLVISEKYWPQGGGAEHATHLILGLLNRNNNDLKITVLTGNNEPHRIDGVNFIYSKMLDTPTKIHLWRNLMTAGKLGFFNDLIRNNDITYIPRLSYPLIPLVKDLGKKVVVHLHDYQPITYCAGIFSKIRSDFKIGLLKDIKRSMAFEISEKRNLYKVLLSSSLTPTNGLVKLWIKHADKVICVSKRQCQIIKSALPEIKNKFEVVYNPLPQIPLCKKKIGDPTFLYLGGDRYYKGFYLVLSAFSDMYKKYRNVKFLLAGGYNQEVKDTLTKINRKRNCLSIYERINETEMLDLYSVSNALLFTSILEEPLSYTVLESMLTGTIPIVSRVGGVPEIVQGTFAERMLYEPNNLEQILDKAEYVLSLSKEQMFNINIGLRNSVLHRFNGEVINQQLSKIILDN